MTEKIQYRYPSFEAKTVGHLSDGDYFYYILDNIRKAKKSIHVVMFIVNTRRKDDPDKKILRILELMEHACWRGLDVKIVLGTSDRAPSIHIGNEITRRILETKNVPVKFAHIEGKSLHSKYVIIDGELVILGSHNWSNNAFSKSKEDSIFIHSKDCAIKLTSEFNKLWENGVYQSHETDD